MSNPDYRGNYALSRGGSQGFPGGRSPGGHDSGHSSRDRGRGRDGNCGIEHRGGRGGREREKIFGGPAIFEENIPAQIPIRLLPENLQQIITRFKSLKVRSERPLRPGYGTAGTKITLQANFFALKVPQVPIYDYTAKISPKTDDNKVKARIFQLLELSPLVQQHLHYVAHDRSQRLVSARKLPQPLNVQISYYDDQNDSTPNGKVFTVSIIFQRELDPGQLSRYVFYRSDRCTKLTNNVGL